MVSKGMVLRETSLNKSQKTPGDSSTAEIAKSKVAEILISGIPEASGLRGPIRFVKLVSHLLAQAYNLPYGAEIYQKCITNPKICQKLPIYRPSGYYVNLI